MHFVIEKEKYPNIRRFMVSHGVSFEASYYDVGLTYVSIISISKDAEIALNKELSKL